MAFFFPSSHPRQHWLLSLFLVFEDLMVQKEAVVLFLSVLLTSGKGASSYNPCALLCAGHSPGPLSLFALLPSALGFWQVYFPAPCRPAFCWVQPVGDASSRSGGRGREAPHSWPQRWTQSWQMLGLPSWLAKWVILDSTGPGGALDISNSGPGSIPGGSRIHQSVFQTALEWEQQAGFSLWALVLAPSLLFLIFSFPHYVSSLLSQPSQNFCSPLTFPRFEISRVFSDCTLPRTLFIQFAQFSGSFEFIFISIL